MNGKQHGQGTETLSDGRKYVGKWMQGFAHGQGIETFPDGSKYEGEWKKARKTIGIMTYSKRIIR